MRIKVIILIMVLSLLPCINHASNNNTVKDSITEKIDNESYDDKDYEENLTYETVHKNLNSLKKTRMYTKMHWEDYKNVDIKWTAKVVDVTSGRGKAIVYLTKKGSNNYKNYNIILYTSNLEIAGNLEKEQEIKFTGMLYKYKPLRKGGVLLYLKDGDIL